MVMDMVVVHTLCNPSTTTRVVSLFCKLCLCWLPTDRWTNRWKDRNADR